MTYPPESRRPETTPHFAPYPVPQSAAGVATPPVVLPGVAGWPPPPRGFEQPAAPPDPRITLGEPVTHDPRVVQGELVIHGEPVTQDAWVAQDPRVAAFGNGAISADPPVVHTLVRWLVPVAIGIVGLLLGIALTSGGDRPSAPVPISAPGATETVTVTSSVSAPSARAVAAKTVTRRVTTTAVKVTTAPPPPPPTVTVRETERVTVTVQRRLPADRRQPVPFVPRG